MAIIVIKIGGEIIDHTQRFQLFVDECASLFQRTDYTAVIVHGGGKQISSLSTRLSITPQFENGLRITNALEMPIVQMVLAGSINSAVVRALQRQGVKAAGVSGVSAGLLQAKPLTGAMAEGNGEPLTDNGANASAVNFTAGSATCNPQLLRQLLAGGYTAVVAPLGLGPDGYSVYNVNADTAAAAIARSLAAELLFVTDVPGVLDNDGAVIKQINRVDCQQLIDTGVVRGGMQAKLTACFAEIESDSVKKAAIGMVQQRDDMLSLIEHIKGTTVLNEAKR